MLLEVYPHHQDAVLDYYINWDAWLAGDTIVTSTWVATGGGVVLSQEAIVGNFTQVWVAGGMAGELIDLTNHIETTEGREEKGTIRLIIKY